MEDGYDDDRSDQSRGGARPRGDPEVNRRQFIRVLAGGLLVAPLVAEAQPSGKLRRIGMLERTSPVTNAANVNGFRQGLRDRGYVEGETFALEYRSADGRDSGSRIWRPSWFR